MNKQELEKLHKKVSAERDVAEKKLNEVKQLHEEIEEEYNARCGFLFCIERLLKLQEN